MKVNIGNKNKIKNSNIGTNNTINKEQKKNYLTEIIVGIIITVVGGIIIYFITK